MNYFLHFWSSTDRQTDRQTESDAYEPTVQIAQVGSKITVSCLLKVIAVHNITITYLRDWITRICCNSYDSIAPVVNRNNAMLPFWSEIDWHDSYTFPSFRFRYFFYLTSA